MDLAEWWASRRWRPLLDLIDQLPAASRLNEAQLNDPDYAAMIAALPEPEGEWSPRVAEYDLHALLLREIREAVVSVKMWTELQATGKKPKKVPLLPAPRTEVEAAKRRLQETAALNLFRIVTPHAMPRI